MPGPILACSARVYWVRRRGEKRELQWRLLLFCIQHSSMHSSSSSPDWIWTPAAPPHPPGRPPLQLLGLGLLFGYCCRCLAAAAVWLQLPFILYMLILRQYYAFMLAVWTTEPYPYVLFGYLLWCVNHWTSTLYAISDFQLPMCYISCFLVHIIEKQPNSGQI